MDEKNAWNTFAQTGQISDYLKYKNVLNTPESICSDKTESKQ